MSHLRGRKHCEALLAAGLPEQVKQGGRGGGRGRERERSFFFLSLIPWR